MDYKRQVLIGLVLTAFFSSLAVFDLLPGWILALLFLAAGILLTYYFVLSRMRLDSLADSSILLKAVNAIGGEKEAAEICRQLGLWSRRMAKSEAALVYWRGEWIFGDEEFTAWAGWETAREWVGNQKEILILNKKGGEIFAHPWPGNIDSLMGLPLMAADEADGVLFLLNEKQRGYYIPQDSEKPELLCRQAAIALSKACDYKALESFNKEILTFLVNALDSRSPGFDGHSRRVARVAALLGKKMGLDKEELCILEYAALLHDAGKVFFLREGFPGEEEELEEIKEEDAARHMEKHPVLGAHILPDEGVYAQIRQGILYHHERYDGSGYPKGLSHTDIPLAARIIAAADLYDALTHLAPEGDRLGAEAAVMEMKKNMGSLLDPLVVVVLEEAGREAFLQDK